MPESDKTPSELSSLPQRAREAAQSADSTPPPNFLATIGLNDQSTGAFAPPPELLGGGLIARKYELLDLLGSGGMGSVYRARHVELDKLVAIKILTVDKPLTDIAFKRFEIEAKATGSLDHPNIVRVSDYGQIGEGSPYIVMELLQGHSLDDLIGEEVCLKVKDALPIFIQLTDALIHAHTRALIHRDLKPSNIMLVRDDKGERQVKIIDFGIAKFCGVRAQAKPLTKPGEIFGSPLYMSPEQCLGQPLDPRSDIYSLGCVMYEMLAGKPPFIGDTVLATIYMHTNEPPAPIKEVAPAAVIPEELEKIIVRALHKNPDMRFQSANELLDALQAFNQKYAKTGPLPENLHGVFFGIFRWLTPVIALFVALCLAVGVWILFLHPNVYPSHAPSHPSHSPHSLQHKLSR
jgi:serine/threonine protein kinase